MPPILSLVSWMIALLFGFVCLARFAVGVTAGRMRQAIAKISFLDPHRVGNGFIATFFMGALAAISLSYFAFSLYAIRRCEAHDDCSLAPAWVGEGLHELQRMDGGCVYLPQGCVPDGGDARSGER